jgi:hypothetical protein
MAADMARDGPGVDVVAARRKSDDDVDGLAL